MTRFCQPLLDHHILLQTEESQSSTEAQGYHGQEGYTRTQKGNQERLPLRRKSYTYSKEGAHTQKITRR